MRDGEDFDYAFWGCSKLKHVGVINFGSANDLYYAFTETDLTEQSKENILVQLEKNTETGVRIHITGGDPLTDIAQAAWDSLQSRGWYGTVE
jgi:organic radical activating enzyme